ncbi:MAG: hypothetical protein EXR98_10695 [Gemmataceae bacterium]|nr:hypothetical protein [Gemmataceae bacterium]
MAKSPRFWLSIGWLAGWSWTERAFIALLALAPFVILFIVGRDGGPVAGGFALAAFVALNVVVFRHGGWRLLGPHFYYDVVRLARRGRSTILRIAYILAMLGGFLYVFDDTPVARAWTPNDFARVSDRFTFTLFLVQNLAVIVLIPAYLASAIAEEKERRTLELLFTTQLSDTEIVLGKLTSRIIHLFGFVIAGFPILSLIQLWGGIDLLLIAGNLLNTLLNILSIGSFCLLISAFCKTVSAAVLSSYAIVMPISLCFASAMRGFPLVLQDARQAGERVLTVQDLGILTVVHLVVTAMCLFLAVVKLRESDMPALDQVIRASAPRPVADASGSFSAVKEPTLSTAIQEEPAPLPIIVAKPTKPPWVQASPEVLARLYSLPPVSDQPLLWKDRYLGGPSWLLSPLVFVPALPFVVLGAMVILFGAVASIGDPHAQQMWHAVMRFFYYVFLICYILGVGYRAAVTVARERQQQTLEPLLLLPIERSEILFAKLAGVLWHGWPWLLLLAGDIVLGTLIGAYHPLSAVLLSLTPWPMILFVATFGLLLSVVLQTVLRATLVMVITLIGLFGCTFIEPPVSYRPWVEVFAFSLQKGLTAHIDDGHKGNLLFVAVMLPLFAAAAFACWKIALVMFENRVRSSGPEV